MDLGLFHRARALLGTSASAVEKDFDQAIEAHSGYAAEHHIARTRLLYGEWLRRQRRRADAIAQLDAALTTFDANRASAFAERTQRELRAAGSRPRRRVDETRNELTVQEQRVAEMAAVGATNGEIAAALYISPHTVSYHLGKVLRKLDIPSRRKLGTALAQQHRTPAPNESPQL